MLEAERVKARAKLTETENKLSNVCNMSVEWIMQDFHQNDFICQFIYQQKTKRPAFSIKNRAFNVCACCPTRTIHYFIELTLA
jgi:hypothetical protein